VKKFIKKTAILFTVMATIGIIGFSIAEAAPTNQIAEEQKEALYNQYVQIIKEVVEEHPGVLMELVPFEEFTQDGWVKPEEFRKLAIERANAKFVVDVEPQAVSMDITPLNDGEFTPQSTVSATKKASITTGGLSRDISITGTFTTQYSSTLKRQVFSGISSLTSSGGTNTEKWTESGKSSRLIDGGRTYSTIVSGGYTINNLTSYHHINVDFHCNANGGVS
jgi:hypothetical protein